MNIERFRVEPSASVDLAEIPTLWRPSSLDDLADEDARRQLRKRVAKRTNELDSLQERLHAEGRHRVLVVLQAIDTGGKDGTIRNVFGPLDAQGVRVASFKVPTEPERAHDYLWRVHAQAPGSGEITVFNRSHYEDVLVVRVHELVEERRWKRRYRHIRDFERLLCDEGTTIVKFFLHISADEQARRLQDRLDSPDKRWKFALGDLEERKRWNDYRAAFEDMLRETSTRRAPWYVVPADDKAARDLIVSEVLVRTLRRLNPQFPEPEDALPTTIDAATPIDGAADAQIPQPSSPLIAPSRNEPTRSNPVP
jgi:PPK2 family polyphosphate:nucleotide phosphotransferase